MGFMNNLRSRREQFGAAAEPAAPAAERTVDDGPPLMLMRPDAGGYAAYVIHAFQSAAAAREFVDANARSQVKEGLVAFWALTSRPASAPRSEPIVIIRDLRKGVVYPFSFSDVESANEFVRHEMKRGLDLGQVMIFWAVPVSIESDSRGRAVLYPASPPAADTASSSRASREPVVSHAGDEEFFDDARTDRPDVPVRIPIHMNGTYAVMHSAEDIGHVIDFEAASRRVQEYRQEHDAAAVGIQNALLAIDEAIDAHVSRVVVARIAWRRISEALAAAAAERERALAATAFRSFTTALAASLATARRRRAIRLGWWSTARGLACAAYLDVRRERLRRAWLNIAWTLEEAAWACSLERKATALRAWRAAGYALAEAAPLAEAAERARLNRVRAGLANMAAATAVAVTAARSEARHSAALAWSNAASALKVAVVVRTRARLLDDEGRLDERERADVEKALGISHNHVPAFSFGSQSADRVSHWQPRGERFRGFGSPSGRF